MQLELVAVANQRVIEGKKNKKGKRQAALKIINYYFYPVPWAYPTCSLPLAS
jgi:hypothetical protein